MTVAGLAQAELSDAEQSLSVLQEEPARYQIEELIKYPSYVEKYLDPHLTADATRTDDSSVQSIVCKAKVLGTDHNVAIKQYDGTDATQRARREAKIQNWLAAHPKVNGAVLSVLSVDQLKISRDLTAAGALVAPWIEGGSYYGKKAHEGSREDLKEVLGVSARVAGLLIVMRSEQVSHGDLRPSNILKNGIVTDFDTAAVLGSAVPRTKRFTKGFTPLEVISTGLATPEGDIFSLTNTTYALLKGALPYIKRSDEEFFESQLKRPIVDLDKKLPMLSSDTIDMLEAGSDPNPNNRPGPAVFQSVINAELELLN